MVNTHHAYSDSMYKNNYKYLEGFALCSCIKQNANYIKNGIGEISEAIYSAVLNFNGTDTITTLAKKFTLTIHASIYADYQGVKPVFLQYPDAFV